MKIETFPLEIKKSIKFNNNYKINVFGIGIYNNLDPEKELKKRKKVKDVEEENKIRRFSLELEIEKSKGSKSLIAIMMNPSVTFPKGKEREESKIDGTVQNVIRIAYVCGYNKLYVYNIFSLINSDSSIQYKTDKFNTDGIINFLKGNNFDTLIAWGENKEKYVQDILKYLKNRNLFVWKLTNKHKPQHPSPLCNKYIKEFLQQPNPKLKPIKFDDNGNIVIC